MCCSPQNCWFPVTFMHNFAKLGQMLDDICPDTRAFNCWKHIFCSEAIMLWLIMVTSMSLILWYHYMLVYILILAFAGSLSEWYLITYNRPAVRSRLLKSVHSMAGECSDTNIFILHFISMSLYTGNWTSVLMQLSDKQ